MKDKRGQAAMEFLMTYGWAILAAVIVVGVLWYMIGNPANLAGNEFQVSQPLTQNAMSINESHVVLEFRNGLSEEITVQNITFHDADCNGMLSNQTVPASDLTDPPISINCDSELESGERFNSEIAIEYKKTGSEVTETASGSIRGVVP